MSAYINRADTHIIPFKFEYHAPTSLDEAIGLLKTFGKEASILAGGTDLLVNMKRRLIEPKHVINIKKVGEMNGIEEKSDGVHFGAATGIRIIERSELIRKKLQILHEATRSLGSIQVRNMATLGGNLCNASPAADCASPLLALGAKAKIANSRGKRTVPLEEFFKGPGETVMEPDELLLSIVVPHLPRGVGSSFLKIGRTSMDISTINAAVVLKVADSFVRDCAIALGSVAPTPIRVHKAEEFLRGKTLTSREIDRAARIVSESISPITDIRATAEYRRQASRTLTRDALKIALERARGG